MTVQITIAGISEDLVTENTLSNDVRLYAADAVKEIVKETINYHMADIMEEYIQDNFRIGSEQLLKILKQAGPEEFI